MTGGNVAKPKYEALQIDDACCELIALDKVVQVGSCLIGILGGRAGQYTLIGPADEVKMVKMLYDEHEKELNAREEDYDEDEGEWFDLVQIARKALE